MIVDQIIAAIKTNIKHDEFRVRISIGYPLKQLVKLNINLQQEFRGLILECWLESNNRNLANAKIIIEGQA